MKQYIVYKYFDDYVDKIYAKCETLEDAEKKKREAEERHRHQPYTSFEIKIEEKQL